MTFGGSATLNSTLGLTQADGTTIKNELVQAKNANIDVDGITGITRSSNSINDVVSGVTLSLLKAEVGTTITMKVEPDLSSIKTAMSDFVTAYNDVRNYVTAQRTPSDLNKDGTVDDSEVGPLAFDQTVRDTLAKLSEMAATSVSGATDGYASLGQVGIVMQSDYTLKLDDTVLDSKLLTNVDAMKTLFSFSSSVSDSRVTVLNRGASTPSGSNALVISGTDASGNVTGATWNGVAMTVSGRTLTAADGTSLFFNGGANLGAVAGITVDIKRGLADQSYDYFNGLTKASTGTIDTQVTQLQTTNQDYKDRVEVIDDRLAVTRKALEAKYTAMETAMAKLQTLQQTIQSYSDSFNASNN
jgi:flagellar hook-associated protein 2